MSLDSKSTLRPGTVALVGAGPGPADLMTLRGRDFLAQADVVLCDALLGDGVRTLIPPGATVVDAGKRSGDHAMSQEAIQDRLIAEAKAGRRVVRLKGGDPFLYGRGGEEVLALGAAGIPVTVVPGLSALLGATALAGVPLTHRGVSDRVLVLSGHGVDEAGWTRGIPADYDGTLVVFMAADRTDRVAARLLEIGWDGTTPSALVEDGAAEHARVTRAPLAEAAQGACLRQGSGPGLFLCGKTSVGLDSTAFQTRPNPGQGAAETDGTIPREEGGERFPVWLDLKDKEVLVVGAGSVALQKVTGLLGAGARVRVVALQVGEGIGRLSHPRLRVSRGPVRFWHFFRKHLVIAATNDPATNLKIAGQARARGVWVNAVDDPPACDFYTGAVVHRGPVHLAIGTGGKLPGLSGLLRRLLEDLLPPEGDLDLARLYRMRARLRAALPDQRERMEAMRAALKQLEDTYFNLSREAGAPSGTPASNTTKDVA